jgi:hypothetical protein
VGPIRFTRSGVIISSVCHGAAALLVVLFTGANPFDSEATEAISVDIISPSEAPPDPWAVPTDPPIEPPKSQLNLAALTPTSLPTPTQQQPQSQPDAKPAEVTKSRREAKPAEATKQAQREAKPAEATKQAQREAEPAEATKQAQREAPRSDSTALSPAKSQELNKAPPSPAQAPPPQPNGAATDGVMGGDQRTEKQTNVANVFSMPLALPDGRLGGAFDAPAMETAKIERSSVDAFRDRIKGCAMLPAGVSPSDRVSLVIRVALKRDGTLAGQPILIEASASPKGPALLQSLFAGLQKCQPFNMLPADKYQEWRTLDVRFTPQDLGQG